MALPSCCDAKRLVGSVAPHVIVRSHVLVAGVLVLVYQLRRATTRINQSEQAVRVDETSCPLSPVDFSRGAHSCNTNAKRKARL